MRSGFFLIIQILLLCGLLAPERLSSKSTGGKKGSERVIPLDDVSQANQVYVLHRFRDSIVAGTQGGAVVWDIARREPVSFHREFICGSLVVHGGAIWAGCDKSVLRWDGRDWKVYLGNSLNDAEQYHLFTGPKNGLFVRYGSSFHQWKEKGFRPWAAPIRGEVNAVMFRRNGELWWLNFDRVFGPRGDFAVRSSAYPGRDPRNFHEDTLGRLWILDFWDGLLRYDEKQARFTRVPGLKERGAGVAVDPKTGYVWMLHYTRGLTIMKDDKRVAVLDLPELREKYSMHRDSGGDIWVTGLTSFMRVRYEKGRFEKTTFVAR